ncbi:hypothetical protein HAX54_008513 [Datura stramonium]|uniref:SHSP domain-containing protein n=1 Tax=Datura stramonium TaxID=4076 RepID=A0ABS8TDB6_DATST|nr:hypothetical protein [Datura stramonium]
MDLELRSKLARVSDEFISTEFLQFPRDQAGLIFQSTETDTMFILTAHLKGYTRGNIKMDINEEGTKMVVTCEKPVQQTVMNEMKVIKKDVELRKFTKVFKIPVGVMLDQIKTNFNEEASILTITMPKRVKGILGTGIQEVKEPELFTQTNSKNLPFTADKIPIRGKFQEDKGAEFSSVGSESAYQKEQVNRETEMQFPSFPWNIKKAHEEVEKHGAKDEFPVKPNGIEEEEKTGELSRAREEEDKLPERRSKICVPVIAGSAVILSLVVFVIHFMRNKKQPGKRKE